MSFDFDMRAVSRIARRVRLADVRLVDLSLRRTSESGGSKLSADIERKCVPLRIDHVAIEVSCHYEFSAKSSQKELAHITLSYNLTYDIEDDDQGPIDAADVDHFAYANGAYNSWPFARELFHSMTSRMGFPAFVLPVLSYAPPRPPPPSTQKTEKLEQPTRSKPRRS